MAMTIRSARERDFDSIMSLLTLLYKGDVGEGLSVLVREYASSTIARRITSLTYADEEAARRRCKNRG